MGTGEGQADILTKERAEIVRSGRLHWFHWTVVFLSLGLTALAWHLSKQQVDQKASDRFGRAADQVLELVSERMRKYELGLWAASRRSRHTAVTSTVGPGKCSLII